MTFIEDSGFARWADTNRIVILFPQVEASVLNPKACWDWWGYTGKDFLTKKAPQIAAIWKMVEQLARGNKAAKAAFPAAAALGQSALYRAGLGIRTRMPPASRLRLALLSR